MIDSRARARAGILMGLGAYFVWGVLPLYFKAVGHVPAMEFVSHRIVWSLFFLGALATAWKKWPTIRAAIATPRIAMILIVTATLIGVNWLVYIYAVVTNHVLEGSLGYYLNPLVNVLLGTILLKERLTVFQKGAVLLAAAGVAVLAAGAGDALWISLTLAASFALYGFIRKVAPVEAIEGLAIESFFLAPLAIGWILWVQQSGQGHFLADRTTDLLLVLGGAVTAVPLLLFTAAAKRLPYSTLGFLQYVAPSMQFLLAVFVFGEALTRAHIVCFAAIWTALAIFVVEGIRSGRKASLELPCDGPPQ
jgi:chloramphenicol-sensitive protein RarD